jgi:hypothetical protein
MAKKGQSGEGTKLKRGEKGTAIRDVILRNPGVGNKAIAEMVSAQGIACTAQDVANIKTRMMKLKRGQRELSADDLKKVKELAQQAGGINRLSESVENLEKMAASVGGLERLKRGLKDLGELMEK